VPAPAVSLADDLAPDRRWALGSLLAAAGARVAGAGPVLTAPSWLEHAVADLARLEELEAPGDEHGRFPAAASRPAAGPRGLDGRVLELRERLREAGVEPQAAGPGGTRFAVALTHDVDTPWRWTRRGLRGAAARGREALRHGHARDAAREAAGLALVPLHRLRGSDPNWRFAEIAALEQRRGFRSTSYVLAAHRVPHDGAAPDEYAARRQDLVDELLGLGCEVGLHASYSSGDVAGRIAEERALLGVAAGRPIAGNRFHYLRMRWHDALRELEQAGFDYDTTLGFAERPGSRAGLSFPFHPWSVAEARPVRFLELPLVLMDATLQEQRYLGLSPARAEELVDELLDRLAELGAAVAVLWHNDRFDRVYGRGYGRVYERLLDGIARRGGWAGRADELCAWWRAERCAS
jgi:hypothetical protein